MNYRDYSKFDHVKFRSNLRDELSRYCRDGTTYEHFNAAAVEKALNKHAPFKKTSVQANDGPFMTKALSKAILLRTRLRNMYKKCKTQEKWNAFKKERNKYTKILRKAKVDCYGILDLKDISDNRKFWKTVKPLFSDKIRTPGSITLLESEELISDDKQVAEVLNDYFINITASLEISEVEENLMDTNEFRDPIGVAVNTHK